MSIPENLQIAGIILAGGTAERLGLVVKANLKIGGKTLLHRCKTSLGADCSHLILSSGTHKPSLFENAGDLICVGDDAEGPARALIKGASYVQEHLPEVQFVVSVAVDAPFLPPDFVRRAMSLLTQDADVVVAAFDGQTYPTNALWRLSALAKMRQMASGEQMPRSLFGLLERQTRVMLDYTDLSTRNPFANVNTPADLVTCNRRAETELI